MGNVDGHAQEEGGRGQEGEVAAHPHVARKPIFVQSSDLLLNAASITLIGLIQLT